MDIRVLGPLAVTVTGRDIPLPAKQATLLGILALQPNRSVSADRLIVALWGDDASPQQLETLQSHVFQLRRRLRAGADGDAPEPGAGRIVTDRQAYRLEIPPTAIDAGRFDALVQHARTAAPSGPSAAVNDLSEALALWRGPNVADVGDDPLAAAEGARLEALRVSAIDLLVQIRLALGEHDELAVELRRAVAEAPYQEHLWASLMLALARSGRRAEALLAYREAEEALRRELDVEPGQELQEIARRIRDGEEAPGSSTAASVRLDARRGHTRDDDAAATAERWPAAARSRRRGPVGALSFALSAGVLLSGSMLPSGAQVVADSVSTLDGTGQVVASTSVGGLPDGILRTDDAVWVVNTSKNSVSLLDRSGTRVVDTIPVGESPTSIAAGFNSIWIANDGDATVSRISTATHNVVGPPISVGVAPYGIATDSRWVWVTNRLDGTLSRIDPKDDKVRTFPVGQTPLGVAATGQDVWVADFEGRQVVRVDPASGVIVGRVDSVPGPTAISARGDEVWVTDTRNDSVDRIDPASELVEQVLPVGGEPAGVTVGENAVWVTVASPPTLLRVDPATGGITRFPLAGSPRAVLSDNESALVTIRAVPAAHRGGTIRVVSGPPAFPNSPDPVYELAWTGNPTLLTHDGLVGYARVSGPDGEQIVADLAAAVPAPSDDGRTWRFQLRHGIRFSTGVPVIASDVAHSIERAVISPDEGSGLTSIEGAAECSGKTSCPMPRGIVTDDAAGTVTFHLSRPDPGFLTALAMPAAAIVPASTPLEQQSSPIPGTGPYKFSRFDEHEVRLVRNVFFAEWSASAQPDGYPDAIDWSSVAAPDDPSAMVEAGTADWDADVMSPDRIAHLTIALPDQLHAGPASTMTFFEAMNPTQPPFDDLRVREAVLLATDRQAALDAYGGPATGRITCQILPPTLPGYQPYCPWTAAPNAAGTWRAPDLERANELIRAAGAAGANVTVLGADGPGHREVAAYFVELLNSLGMNAKATLFPPTFFFMDPDSPIQHPSDIQVAGYWSLGRDVKASSWFAGAFTCPDFPSVVYSPPYPTQTCDHDLDQKVAYALSLDAESDRSKANAAWAQIDRDVTDMAVVDPMFNPTDVAFVSARVGNVQFHPIWRVLLDQLWVK